MKFHSSVVGKFIVYPIVLVIEFTFGLGVYLMLAASTDVIIGSTGSAIFAVIGGGFTAIGGIWVFLYGEYSMTDVIAYSKAHKENNVRVYSMYAVQVLFLALDFIALLYRSQFLPSNGKFLLISFGVIFMLLVFALGKILHAMENKPIDAVMSQTTQQLTDNVATDLRKVLVSMDLPDQLAFLNGNIEVAKKYISEKRKVVDAGPTLDKLLDTPDFQPALLSQAGEQQSTTPPLNQSKPLKLTRK